MVGDLFVDLRNGHNLITLLEILTQERLVSHVSLMSSLFLVSLADFFLECPTAVRFHCV